MTARIAPRRAVPPRAVIQLSDRMLAAARQHAEGVTTVELARLYNVSRGTVVQWCQKVKAAREDAANMAALRDDG